jgi:hypothetical protein
MVPQLRPSNEHSALSHSALSMGEWPASSQSARSFFTRPPTGTPRRAINPGEGLPVSYVFLGGSG